MATKKERLREKRLSRLVKRRIQVSDARPHPYTAPLAELAWLVEHGARLGIEVYRRPGQSYRAGDGALWCAIDFQGQPATVAELRRLHAEYQAELRGKPATRL